MKTGLYIIFFAFTGITFSQNVILPYHHFILEENKQLLFSEINETKFNNTKSDSDFSYPLNTGDFWEYIVVDTTTFMGYEGLKYSVVKEVIGDTIMPNAINYKIIKWEKCANSINESPNYEFQRMDTSGKIFVWFNNKDNLLYDFNLNSLEYYQSQYEGYRWHILRKYTVEGFGKVYKAIDFGLYDASGMRRRETVIEGFGLTNYAGDINRYPDIPNGDFFGGIISDSTYGYLLARKQVIDWIEFYPLYIGDFWKYISYSEHTTSISTKKVLQDSIMSDGNVYKVCEYEFYSEEYPRKGTGYERSDSIGNVWVWYTSDSSSHRKYQFRLCLGDTLTAGPPGSYFRLDDKDFSNIHYFMYPDITFYGFDFTRGLGLTQTTYEGGGSYLAGAVINGIAYGDTSVTGIEDKFSDYPGNFILYQNYPNPFNPITTIKYSIRSYSYVSIIVYDILGREVQILVDEQKPAGEYKISFNASGLSSGVYFYRLKTNHSILTNKMILLR